MSSAGRPRARVARGKSIPALLALLIACVGALPPAAQAAATAPSAPHQPVLSGPDTTAPTVPSAVVARATASDRVEVTWSRSSDDVAVARYTIARNGADVAIVDGSVASFLDRTTSPTTAYAYTVRARDAAGNVSSASVAASVTTPTCTCSSSIARPTSDVSNSGFTPNTGSTRYTQLDETTSDGDTTYIKGPSSGTANTVVGVGPVPSGTIYSVTVAYSARQFVSAGQAGAMNVHAELWNGSTLLGTGVTRNLATAYQTHSETFAVVLTAPTLRVKLVQETAGTTKRTSRFTWVQVTVQYRALDSTPPTVPSTLKSEFTCANTVGASWNVASDAVGVQGYRVFRNGTQIATVPAGAPAPVKRFDFVTGAQGFIPTGNVASAIGGSLEGRADGPGNWDQLWTWVGTWDRLGVPNGATVSSIQLTRLDIAAEVQVAPFGGELTVGNVSVTEPGGVSYGVLYDGMNLPSGVYPSLSAGAQAAVGIGAPASSWLNLKIESGISGQDVYSAWWLDNLELRITWTGGSTRVRITDVGLTANTDYRYSVVAVDSAGNASSASTEIVTRTLTQDPDPVDADCDRLSDETEDLLGTSTGDADSDDDALTDDFEAHRAFLAHDPAIADTDSDGTLDSAEDFDADGLSALVEQTRGSNPLDVDPDFDGLTDPVELDVHGTDPNVEDTDQDGLDDGAEVALGTDPLDPDTDDDGVLDGAETLTATVDGPSGASVAIHGSGDLTNAVDIVDRSADVGTFPAGGQKGATFEFTIDESSGATMTSAEITLPYSPADPTLGDPADLAVFVFDPLLGTWVPAADDFVVDQTNHTVTATVTHFSIYAVFSLAQWVSFWEGPPCDSGPDPGDITWVDVALVLDSSGSMSWNDPQDLRRDAAKRFVDLLTPPLDGAGGDRGAVVDFDHVAQLLQQLTTDKAALKAAIDLIDSDGGTVLSAGMQVGLDELTRVPAEPNRQRVVIMLTDGDGAYDNAHTTRAIAEDVIVFTVGLGSSVNETLLRDIATQTGGAYFPAASAAELEEIFEDISGEIGADRDNDGLTDCQEVDGLVYVADGRLFTSDPEDADTDDDGLLDGDEMYEVTFTLGELTITLPAVLSNPRVVDSDFDSLVDGEELEIGSSAFRADDDGDGLDDGDELFDGTNPSRRDTDFDGYDDLFESTHEADGFDPRFFDEHKTKNSWADDFAVGAVLGEKEPRDTIPWLLGNLSASIVPVGGTVADVRDAIFGAINGDLLGAAFCVAGIVPILGDGAAGINKIRKFLDRFPTKTDALLAALVRVNFMPNWMKMDILRAFRGDAVATLGQKGLADENIIKLAKGRHGLDGLAGLLRGLPDTSIIRGAGWFPGGLNGGRAAELSTGTRLADDFPSVDLTKHKIRGISETRFPDARTYDVANPIEDIDIPHIHEVKTGWADGSIVRRQILKDVAAAQANRAQSITWHFFSSDLSSSVGPSAEFLTFIQGLPVPVNIVVYLP